MELARVFKDGMILQRDIPICIWGHSETAQTLKVRLNGKFLCEAKVNAGKFTIQLPAQSAMEDAVLEIGGITLRHIDIGEVWVAGGQSNMEFMLQFDKDGATEIAAANDTHLRTYIVGQYSYSGEREAGYKAWNPWDRWLPFTPEHAAELPAAAVYFAKELRAKGVPVGILSCNWGGTTASAWTERRRLEADPILRVYTDEFDQMAAGLDMARYQAIRAAVRPAMASPESQAMSQMLMRNTFHPSELQKKLAAQGSGNSSISPVIPGIDPNTLSMEELMLEGPGDKNEPGALFENMVIEIAGYTVRGVIWYQGESDEHHANIYARLFRTMIENWREAWVEKNTAQILLPFLFVQLAPYGVWLVNTSENYPELRHQQQAVADTVPDTFMAAIGDVGNIYDIHPRAKCSVGRRLALLARKYIYHETELPADAPRAIRLERQADTLRVCFANADGLYLRSEDFNCYNGFSLDVIDHALRPPVLGGVGGLCVLTGENPLAEAYCAVEKDTLVIRSETLTTAEQVTVEFAQTPFYQVNLFNRSDIPALPFRLIAKKETL